MLGNNSTQTRPIEQYSTEFYKPDFVAGTLAHEAAARSTSAGLGTGHAATAADKPRLYYLGIGISHYQHLNPDDDLQFAATDAIDLGTALKSQEGKAFEKVETKTLTETQVTRSEVFAEAKDSYREHAIRMSSSCFWRAMASTQTSPDITFSPTMSIRPGVHRPRSLGPHSTHCCGMYAHQ